MQVISWHRKWEVVFFLPKITRHFILLTDKMKIHRVHNYSYDLRLNESLDSRNAEKMLHNRKKRRETMLWNRQYLWATEIMWVANQAIPDLCTRKVNIYGTMERTWVSSCSFLLKWMQGKKLLMPFYFATWWNEQKIMHSVGMDIQCSCSECFRHRQKSQTLRLRFF